MEANYKGVFQDVKWSLNIPKRDCMFLSRKYIR